MPLLVGVLSALCCVRIGGLKVWLVLGATLIVYTAALYKAAVKWKGTRDEVSCVNISYNMCVAGIGHNTLDLGKSYIRGTSLGWLFFCFLAAEACKLTASAHPPQPQHAPTRLLTHMPPGPPVR